MVRLPRGAKLIAYYRVSNQKQGISTLGLSAQRKECSQFAKKNGYEIVEAYQEIESGRKSDRHRPQLKMAIAHAKQINATIVCAKLDRLTRNVSFLTMLLDSQVKFVALDVPEMQDPATTKMLLITLANIAEYEASLARPRTTKALAVRAKQLKEPGQTTSKGLKRLGAPDPKIGARASVIASKKRSYDKIDKICETIVQIKEKGHTTLKDIAIQLNVRGIEVLRGRKIPGRSHDIDTVWYSEDKNGKPIIDKRSSLRQLMIKGGIYGRSS